jgi:hypothetical protein
LYDFSAGYDANSVAFKVSEISIVEASWGTLANLVLTLAVATFGFRIIGWVADSQSQFDHH